jgi:hypothetical protein
MARRERRGDSLLDRHDRDAAEGCQKLTMKGMKGVKGNTDELLLPEISSRPSPCSLLHGVLLGDQ